MTPYLALVLTGYAVFIVVLGAYWLRQVVAERRAKTAQAQVPVTPARRPQEPERRRAA